MNRDKWYKIIQMLARLIIWPWPIKVEGELPSEGALLIVANHSSVIDPPLLAIKLNRRLWFLARKNIFKWKFVGWLMKKLDWALPVSKDSPLSLRRTITLLKQGKPIVIFPEGRCVSGLGKFAEGFAWLANKTKTPILPIAILGTGKVLPPGKKFPRFAKITIKIGEPILIVPGQTDQDLIDLTVEKISLLLSLPPACADKVQASQG